MFRQSTYGRAAAWAIAVLSVAACSGDDDVASKGIKAAPETSPAPATSPASTAPVTTVVVTDPATLPPTTEPVTAEPAPPPTLFPSPPIDESFRFLIPRVEGFDTDDSVDLIWPLFDLPGGAGAYAVKIVPVGSTESIGTLVVAGRTESNQLFETYARRLFDEPVPVVVEGMTPLEDGTMAVSSNNAPASWQPIADAAVIVAKLPDLDAGKWVWRHDELIWIVTGSLAAEQYVAGLVQAQGAGSDPFNFQGLHGDLIQRFPTIPAVQYWDVPRPVALTQMQQAWSAPCAAEFFYAYVPALDDPDPESPDEATLFIDVSRIADACAGYVDGLVAELGERSDFRAETIAGRSVFRNDREILYVSDDILVHLSSQDPQTLVDMALVIDAFMRGQD